MSSDLQSTASIEDQLRICAEWAAKQGLLVAGSYTDQGISGASLIRPGIQKLLQDAAAGMRLEQAVEFKVTKPNDFLSW